MDKALKERKMASASARRQRGQERQKQKDLLREEREERKKTMRRHQETDTINDSNDSSDSDDSRPGSPENDSSAETPSEYSLRTPENLSSPDVAIEGSIVRMVAPEDSNKDDDAITITKPTILERRRSRPLSGKSIVFSSTLSSPHDFRYDRFSTFMPALEIPLPSEEAKAEAPRPTKKGNKEEEESTGEKREDTEEDDDDEDDDNSSDSGDDYSPIELATPVAIRMPMSRPSKVSVVGATAAQTGPQKFSVKNINTIMINPPKQPAPKPRIIETLPTPEAREQKDYVSIHPVKSVETITPSSSSIISVEPSSTRSLPGTATQSVDNSLRKKSSMPMLTKFTHARMNSIKNFMKPQSISGPPPAVPLIPSAHQPRPSESMSNILLNASAHRSRASVASKNLPPSPRRSLTEPNLLPPAQPTRKPQPERRPQTSRSNSQSILTAFPNYSSNNVTAVPPPRAITPTIPPPPKPTSEDTDAPAMGRKKSFSNLRRRSGSLGQALKFGSSSGSKTKTPTPEAPLPPMPMIRVPTQESVQMLNAPSPPPKTPRSVRKSGMMYSPFPPASQKGEPVGLGLRL